MTRSMSSVFAIVLAASAGGPWGAGPGLAPQEAPEIDLARSYFVAVTGKAGIFGFLGHRHGVLATEWEAEVDWRPEARESSTVSITVNSAALVIDSEQARRRARLGSGPGEEDVAEIQAKMLDDEHLAAERHPIITFRSTEVEERGDRRLRVHGQFAMLGVDNPVRVDVDVRTIQDYTVFAGEFEIEQRDFGLEPESIGGVVKVSNDVKILFELWMR